MATQEIGLVVDLSSGNYVKTVYRDNKLQLAEQGIKDGVIIYEEAGYWESNPIMIGDKVASFKNIARTIQVNGEAFYKIYIKTSEDGFVWGDYVLVSTDGTINNPPEKYAVIKIEIISAKVNHAFYIDKFDTQDNYENEFTNSSNEILELKNNFTFKMDIVTEVPDLFIKKIPNSKLKLIDKISQN